MVEGFSIGAVVFLAFAMIGLILLAVGIIFLVMNIKWKARKEQQGIQPTSNIIAMVIFCMMIFFGVMWFFCFGAGAIVFGVLGVSF